ncbi:hypothetical protein GCM10023321_35970 [Pseudonocardia eucalypti]|uniref:ATP-grasp domain-containing protein n=1 Tax=Pseudonocardia eucalypti TaxID=648755 RepID=A0ABP9QBA3_9PSEU|nr:putative ATP-grasp superfamily ATP-dependent carboligase [Pseudonocardia eucalypti]
MTRRPALLVGGGTNTLSVGRRLAAIGVPVYGLATTPEIRFSRAFREVFWPAGAPAGGRENEERTAEWLLGEPGARFAGAVMLACSDATLRVVARNREALAERFTLDVSDPVAQMDMLNKRSTYEIATKSDVPTPLYWTVQDLDEVIERRHEFVYPLLAKPVFSHEYEARFRGKFRTANSPDELVTEYRELGEAGIECMLVETIPGPDSLLCSYFTYVDESGEPMFDFTKRVIRRCPPMRGVACYHATTNDPEVRELGRRFVQASGLRGLANVEFKRDTRDGQLKLIECNARFVAPDALVAAAGVELAQLVYRRLTGETVQWPTEYRSGLRMWAPVDDLRALIALRRAGELTVPAWLRSVAHRQMLQVFRWDDPLPAVARGAGRVRKVLTGNYR